MTIIHVCSRCQKQFTQKTHYRYHINRKNKCNVVPKYKCRRCKKSFNTDLSLNNHYIKLNKCIYKKGGKRTYTHIREFQLHKLQREEKELQSIMNVSNLELDVLISKFKLKRLECKNYYLLYN